MEVNWNTKENNQLLRAILSLESTDEAKRFLRDLMTEGEIEEFAKQCWVCFYYRADWPFFYHNRSYLQMAERLTWWLPPRPLSPIKSSSQF
jgi:hypothetical protein